MKPNELAEQIKKAGKQQRVIEFQCPYIPECHVSLAFANRFVLNQIREAAREVFKNSRTGLQEERFNDEKLRAAYAQHVIQDWKGLTYEKLQKLIPGLEIQDERAEKKIDLKDDVPFDTGVAAAMLNASIEFENWVIDIASNVDNYSHIAEQKKKETENLK